VTLGWTDSSSNETGFRIERRQGAGAYLTVGEVGANATTFADRNVVPSTAYTYRVIAFNGAGDSTPSNEAPVRPPPPADTTPPRLTIKGPADGSHVRSSEVRVEAGTIDEYVPIEIDGQPARDLDGDGYLEATVALPRDGVRVIVVVARDAAGNEARETLRVVRDTVAPRVVLDRPPGVVAEPSVTLSGRVDDADPEVALEVAGEAVDLTAGRFSVRRPLVEGPNRIRIVARDRAGNRSERVEEIAYRKPPPPPPPPPADPVADAFREIEAAQRREDHGEAARLLRDLLARGGLPRDREVEAVGRLAAILDRRLGEWREALPYYRRYRALGGEDRRLLQRLRELEDRY